MTAVTPRRKLQRAPAVRSWSGGSPRNGTWGRRGEGNGLWPPDISEIGALAAWAATRGWVTLSLHGQRLGLEDRGEAPDQCFSRRWMFLKGKLLPFWVVFFEEFCEAALPGKLFLGLTGAVAWCIWWCLSLLWRFWTSGVQQSFSLLCGVQAYQSMLRERERPSFDPALGVRVLFHLAMLSSRSLLLRAGCPQTIFPCRLCVTSRFVICDCAVLGFFPA